MTHATLNGAFDSRSTDLVPNEWGLLNEVASYQGNRQRVGATKLTTEDNGREVIIWSFDDGEHLVMLLHGKRIAHWEPTREPYDQLHARACDWLTEPASQSRK